MTGAQGGHRSFMERPAFDLQGVAKNEKQRDNWLVASIEARWQVLDALQINASYRYFRQASNDALWDYDRHTAFLTLETWLENQKTTTC